MYEYVYVCTYVRTYVCYRYVQISGQIVAAMHISISSHHPVWPDGSK
jgi:hypothetical protein